MVATSENLRRQSLMLEARYRLLVDAIGDHARHMLDANGLVSSWNADAQHLFGYSEPEIVGRPVSLFSIAEDRVAGLPETALELAARAGRFETEGWRLRNDRSRFWVQVLVDAVRNDTGELIGFAMITRDFSKRRAAETELARSEAQFRLIVQSVTDYAIYMLDPKGIVTSWNAGAERIKGYAATEIVGEHFSRFFTPEDRQSGEPLRALDIAAREGRFEKEARRVRKDGTHFWAHVVIDPIRSETGTLIGYAKVTRDITERINAQRVLDQKQSELFQSQKMEVIGQLTGGFAHDFNNLLMVMLGSLEMLAKRLPKTREFLPLIDNAMQSGQRGAALIQRMLVFSRQEEARFAPLDIVDLVSGMVKLITRSIGPMIRVETRFPPALPHILSEPNQLSSALLNLAVNARDAMPEGGSLTISGVEKRVGAGDTKDGDVQDLAAGRYVCLSLRDEGRGMDAETLSKAVRPFFTTKPIGKGTGLGLSMVKTLMDQSGGRLILRSAPGKGTVIDLWLPVVEAAGDGEGPDAVASLVPPGRQILRILAVDDDDLVLRNTVLMLEDLGHNVMKAASGEEALDMIESQSAIDLVLTDYAMPMMTGSELADIVWKRNPALPIVLATGYAKLPLGANPALRLISKPFSQAQLTDIIERSVAG